MSQINADLFDAIIEATTIPTEGGRRKAITHLLNRMVDDALDTLDAGDAACEAFAERIRDQRYTYRGTSR